MATPIIHLGIAEKLLDMMNIGDKPQFLLGAISPDSIHKVHTYCDIERYDSSYVASHLYDDDFSVWRENVREFIRSKKEDEFSEYFLGQAVHILTDIRWKETLYNEFKVECANIDMQADEVRALYCRDMQLFEWALCKRIASRVPEYLSYTGAYATPDLLTYRDSVIDVFSNGCEGGTIKYFTVGTMTVFIANTAIEIAKFLKSVYSASEGVEEVKEKQPEVTKKKRKSYTRRTSELEQRFLAYLRDNCVGSENAIQSKRLEALFGVNGETIRDMTNTLRRGTAQVCSSRLGYWYSSDGYDSKETILNLYSRAEGIKRAADGMALGLFNEFGMTLEDDGESSEGE